MILFSVSHYLRRIHVKGFVYPCCYLTKYTVSARFAKHPLAPAQGHPKAVRYCPGDRSIASSGYCGTPLNGAHGDLFAARYIDLLEGYLRSYHLLLVVLPHKICHGFIDNALHQVPVAIINIVRMFQRGGRRFGATGEARYNQQ